jgi:hypothetical protein
VEEKLARFSDMAKDLIIFKSTILLLELIRLQIQQKV